MVSSARRVEEHSPEHANEQIRLRTEQRLAWYRQHPEHIDERLRELDQEWDVERVLELGSSSLSLLGLLMGTLRSRKWYLLSLAVQGFFLQHAIQGWCPPVELFRRMGFRTPHEIEHERCALYALRDGAQGRPS